MTRDEPGAQTGKGKILRLEDVKKALTAHKAELKSQGVKSLAVFGSVARGDARPGSDVDLLAEFERPFGLFKFVEVKAYLEDLLGGAEVDLVVRDAVYEELRDIIYGEAVNVL
jgi:hypothetical protein